MSLPPPLPPQPPAFRPQEVVYVPVYVPEKKKTGCVTWGVAVLGVFFIVAVIIGALKKDDPAGNYISSIKGTAMEIVKSRLKDGKSAEFDLQSIGWKQRMDGDFHVWGQVRASNSFGAMLNNSWQVVMREEDGDRWTALWVKIGSDPEGNYLPDVKPGEPVQGE